jgi:hypothetical protein
MRDQNRISNTARTPRFQVVWNANGYFNRPWNVRRRMDGFSGVVLLETPVQLVGEIDGCPGGMGGAAKQVDVAYRPPLVIAGGVNHPESDKCARGASQLRAQRLSALGVPRPVLESVEPRATPTRLKKFPRTCACAPSGSFLVWSTGERPKKRTPSPF